jgi:Protein of unknown function (DUF3703)
MDLLRTCFKEELDRARERRAAGDIAGAWSALERSHILSQSRVGLHLRSHWEMLVLAWATRDGREVRGQLLRLLLAGPASAMNRAPLGNTGRASVGVFTPMPISPELRTKLERAGVLLPSSAAPAR